MVGLAHRARSAAGPSRTRIPFGRNNCTPFARLRHHPVVVSFGMRSLSKHKSFPRRRQSSPSAPAFAEAQPCKLSLRALYGESQEPRRRAKMRPPPRYPAFLCEQCPYSDRAPGNDAASARVLRLPGERVGGGLAAFPGRPTSKAFLPTRIAPPLFESAQPASFRLAPVRWERAG